MLLELDVAGDLAVHDGLVARAVVVPADLGAGVGHGPSEAQARRGGLSPEPRAVAAFGSRAVTGRHETHVP
ncbi:hypothetical protein GCM10027194_32770 [Thalassiella azotivora]